MNTGTDRATIITVVLASLFAFVIGVAVGFITTFTHRGVPPWGLDRRPRGRRRRSSSASGWCSRAASSVPPPRSASIGATALLMLPGAGGTVFVLDDPIGYAWAIGPTVLAAAALAWPNPVARRNRAAGRPRMDA